MAIYRTKTESDFAMYGQYREQHVTIPDEWNKDNGQERIDDPAWIQRYE